MNNKTILSGISQKPIECPHLSLLTLPKITFRPNQLGDVKLGRGVNEFMVAHEHSLEYNDQNKCQHVGVWQGVRQQWDKNLEQKGGLEDTCWSIYREGSDQEKPEKRLNEWLEKSAGQQPANSETNSRENGISEESV